MSRLNRHMRRAAERRASLEQQAQALSDVLYQQRFSWRLKFGLRLILGWRQ